MAKPTHDYDSPDFYKLIEQLAMNGYTDEEIANELNLSADVFGAMKNGNYQGWNDDENKRRGSEIYRVLAHGRTKIFAYSAVRTSKARLAERRPNPKSLNMFKINASVWGKIRNAPIAVVQDGLH